MLFVACCPGVGEDRFEAWMTIRKNNHTLLRKRHKPLGLIEVIAIALGGMVGGEIFTISEICVAMIGVYTPVAI